MFSDLPRDYDGFVDAHELLPCPVCRKVHLEPCCPIDEAASRPEARRA